VETTEKASAEAEAEARAAEERAAAEAGGGGGPAAPAPQPTAAAVLARERRLDAVSNARAVAAGEHYYRAMASRAGSTWNARDTAMVLTVRAVEEHVRAVGVKEPRILVWAHDSHLGRAGSSEMSVRRGETNVGELLTTLYGREVLAVGQFTHAGTVAAARAWGRVVESRGVRPALPGSVEALFHAAVSADTGTPHKRGQIIKKRRYVCAATPKRKSEEARRGRAFILPSSSRREGLRAHSLAW
jgi:erythromycin esterase-like protein